MPVVQGPEGPVPFPDDMSDAEIEKAMQENYPPVSEASDVGHSAVQWARDTGEHLLAIPKQVDDLERTINNWLKTSGAESPFAQAFGLSGPMKATGEFLDRYTPKESTLASLSERRPIDLPQMLPSGIENGGIPAPSLEESKWTGQQLFGDPYQPQTEAGKWTGPVLDTVGGLALGGPMMGRFGALAAKYGPKYAERMIQGAAFAGGGYGVHEGIKAMKGESPWTPYK